MRITVDLDDDLLLAVEQRRTACKTTGEVLAELARHGLQTTSAPKIVPVRGSTLRRDEADVVVTRTSA